MNIIAKLFHLSDIRYGWLLMFSAVIFFGSLVYGKLYPDISVYAEWSTYGLAFTLGLFWAIFNYIDHIKIGSLYRKQSDIDTYVNSLAINSEEKDELRGYLEDYASDMRVQGNTPEESVRMAINQFKVKEFVSLSYNPIFNLPVHYYLLGYTFIALAAALLFEIATMISSIDSFWIAALKFILLSYSIGLIGVFVLYRIVDAALNRKINI